MVDWKVSEITKQEAALRQLDQAIRSFFRRDDMLAVHTLTAAASGLLTDLGILSGVRGFLRESDKIRPEYRKEWLAALSKTQNFLKHADRDATSTHRYNEQETVYLLFETVDLARRLVKVDSRERLAFRLWFIMSFPHLIEPGFLETLRGAANEANTDPTDRDLWHVWLGRA